MALQLHKWSEIEGNVEGQQVEFVFQTNHKTHAPKGLQLGFINLHIPCMWSCAKKCIQPATDQPGMDPGNHGSRNIPPAEIQNTFNGDGFGNPLNHRKTKRLLIHANARSTPVNLSLCAEIEKILNKEKQNGNPEGHD